MHTQTPLGNPLTAMLAFLPIFFHEKDVRIIIIIIFFMETSTECLFDFYKPRLGFSLDLARP